MSSALPVIPKPSGRGDPSQMLFNQNVRQTIQVLTGRLGTPIVHLEDSATTQEIIDKLNEILTLLQG